MKLDDICKILTESLIQLDKLKEEDNSFSYEVDLFDYGYLDSFGVVELFKKFVTYIAPSKLVLRYSWIRQTLILFFKCRMQLFRKF